MNNYDVISARSVAKNLNNRVYTDLYYRLMLMARSVFEWKNLDKIGIDEKHIEKYLFAYGSCMFFKDKTKRPGLKQIIGILLVILGICLINK